MRFILADYVLCGVAFRHDHVVVRCSDLPDFSNQVRYSLIALVHKEVKLRVGVLIKRILLHTEASSCIETHITIVLLGADHPAGRLIRLAQLSTVVDEHIMLRHLMLAHYVVLAGHLRLE